QSNHFGTCYFIEERENFISILSVILIDCHIDILKCAFLRQSTKYFHYLFFHVIRYLDFSRSSIHSCFASIGEIEMRKDQIDNFIGKIEKRRIQFNFSQIF
ncbi:hypothetical protein PFISCL1PPCAC_18940, partial [Pristionchus fissidentatus]